MKYFSWFLCLILFSNVSCFSQDSKKVKNENFKVDLIVFSYDRPLQLYSCLESVRKYVKSGLGEVFVIYRISDDKFEKAYKKIKDNFSFIKMFKQNSETPKEDFKPLLLKVLLKKSINNYVAFVVDDIIVKDFIDLKTCVKAIEKHNAYGFYLRLGSNTTENYTIPFKNKELPKFKKCENGILSWKFKDGTGGDWSYPNTVDMTVYSKVDISKILKQLNYNSPNTLEGSWAKKVDSEWKGLCFEKSKIVNIPLNIVQQDCNNQHMDGYSADKLLEIFNGGYKIDISRLYKVENKAPHMPHDPTFILRDAQNKLYEELKSYEPKENKHIVVVVPSYKNKAWYKYNIDSVIKQKYANFDLIYIDDVSPDGTGDFVEKYIKENNFESHTLLIKNTERCGALANLYKAIHLCKDEDIVVTLDGDDWFATDYVLELVNKVYNKFGVWLTYGNYRCYPHDRGSACAYFPKEIIESNSFRAYRWCASHLRTFYAWLFKKIKVEDLMYEDKFYPMAWDLAMMYPMLEMCDGKFMFIPDTLYIYNIDNPINDSKVNLELQERLDKHIRFLQKYSPLR